MAYIEVDVHIDIEDYLHEVDTDGLIQEFKGRSLTPDQIVEVGSICGVKSYSLLDEMKMEIITKGFQQKSVSELEDFFK